jgi:hypothetical protein
MADAPFSPRSFFRVSSSDLVASAIIGSILGPLIAVGMWVVDRATGATPSLPRYGEGPAGIVLTLAAYALGLAALMLVSAWRQSLDPERPRGSAFEIPLTCAIVMIVIYAGGSPERSDMNLAARLLFLLVGITLGSLMIAPVRRWVRRR